MPTNPQVSPARPDKAADSAEWETALQNAEQFLAKTAEAVHPDLAPRTMMRYLTQYRAHLYDVVATTRHQQGRRIGQHT